MSTELKYRYPGIKPFTTEEQKLFFGRDKEIQNVLELIDLEKILVLYSKSGIGKSSLLNAGIIPQFEKNYKHYKYVNIRFGAFFENNQQSPIQKLIDIIQKTYPVKPISEVLNISEYENLNSLSTLWPNIKSLQLENPQDTFVLIFDQFEELFSYSKDEVIEFKNQLFELLYTKIPAKFKNEISDLISEENFNILNSLPKIKLIFTIRSDRMSFLNQLKDTIPSILQNTYELLPLTCKQAEDAIVIPANMDNQEFKFVSPIFKYNTEALKKIINYLSDNQTKAVETFQLQIICQYIENLVIEKGISEIKTEHIENIENIFNNYYQSILNKISDNEQRNKAQILIEEKLIIEERRISLDEIICKKEVLESVLQILVDSRLLRRMPTSLGGFSYEISHDTLIKPILETKNIRKSIENQKEEKYKINFKITLKYVIGLFSIFLGIMLMYIFGIKYISITIVRIAFPLSIFILYKIFRINKSTNSILNLRYFIIYINLFLILLLYVCEIKFSVNYFQIIKIVFIISIFVNIISLVFFILTLIKEKINLMKFNDLTFLIVFFIMIFLNISNFSKISTNVFSNQIFMIKKIEFENKKIALINNKIFVQFENKNFNINKLRFQANILYLTIDTTVSKLIENYNIDSIDFKTHYFYEYEAFVQEFLFKEKQCQVLVNEINEFNKCSKIISSNSGIEFILDTKMYFTEDGQFYDLIRINFGLSPLISAVLNLKLLQKDLLLVENNCLNNYKYQLLEQKYNKLDSILISK